LLLLTREPRRRGNAEPCPPLARQPDLWAGTGNPVLHGAHGASGWSRHSPAGHLLARTRQL